MKRWIGAAILAVPLMLGSTAAINIAVAAPSQTAARQSDAVKATDLGARRHDRRYAHRPVYQPAYYGRPTYYRPYPYELPVPFFLGFGFGPLW
jgi:hypothetical protein